MTPTQVTVTLSYIIATFFGLGYAPVAAGSVASAAAVLLWWVAAPVSTAAQWWVGWGITAAGLWASGRTAAQLRDHDPAIVVIDEVAGMWLTLAGTPRTLPVVLLGFGLFRLLDIAKWPPIRQLERLPGGWGIMLDDVAAGLIARVILALAIPHIAPLV